MIRTSPAPMLAAAVAACALGSATTGAQGAPAAQPALPHLTSLTATLADGLRVAIVRDPIGPVVTTEMNYLVGSVDSPPDVPGMAHAQEHMLFRGSDGLAADQLEAITAELGGDANADTRPTVTQYQFTVPAADLSFVLRIEASRMRGIDDDQAAWERERGAIEQEVEADDSNPEYAALRAMRGIGFDGTPYAVDGVGTRASFDALSAERLKAFYTSWYGPNNAVLVIAGDVDPPAALAQVKALFAAIPARPTPPHVPVTLRPLRRARAAVHASFAYALGFISYRLPGLSSPDYAAGQILADVLQSKRGSLADLVAQGRALDVIFEQNEPLPASGFGTEIVVMPPEQGADAAVSAVESAIGDYAEHGVPDDLVQAAKRRELVEAAEEETSVPLVARAWSDAIAVGGRSSPDDDLAAVVAVTTDDVSRVAKQYLSPGQAIVADVRPGDRRAVGGGPVHESFAPTASAAVPLPAWAAALLAPDAQAARPAPASMVLPNGIHLIVQPEPGNPSVEVTGQVRTVPLLETPQGQEGVADVEEDLFDYGSTTLDRTQFQAALDGIGADATTGTRFSIRMLAGDLDRGVQLLADDELHPAFPEAAFRIVRQRREGVANGRLNSADYQAERMTDRGLYPLFDPVLRETTPDTVGSLTLDNVKSYYAATFRPDLTTIVVIGNVTPDAAAAAIERWFGGWSSYQAPPAVELPAVPANDASSGVLSPPGASQDRVTLAETLGIVRSDDDYYALRLGDEILAGQTLSSRLYRDLRENRGLVYAVNSALDVGQTRSILRIDFGCDPADTSLAVAVVEGDLATMRAAPVLPADVQRAKALLLRRIALADASEDAIAAGLLDRAVQGLPLDEPAIAAQRYAAVTPADVERAFARWIRPNAFVEVVEGPQPR